MSFSGVPTISNGRRYDDGDEYARSSSSSSKYYKKNGNKNGSPELRHDNHVIPHSSSYFGKSASQDYESRARSLSQQLAAAQSQVMALENQLSNMTMAKTHAEHRLFALQQDLSQSQKSNKEIIDVMRTLEIGVETLQGEKNALMAERDELKAKFEASEKNSAVLNEQVSYLNERNSTLSKKCVDLLDGSKEFREKATTYEQELKRIKPRYEEMEAKFEGLNEQNKNFSTRLNMFEMRERIWIREKAELEDRQKMTVENLQKIIGEIRQNHEIELARLRSGHFHPMPNHNLNMLPMPNGPSKPEMEKIEQHIKGLHQLLESIQRHHKSELDRYQKRIEQLERIADELYKANKEGSKSGLESTMKSQNNQAEELDALLDEEEIILLDDSPPSDRCERKAGPTTPKSETTEEKEPSF